MLSDILKKVMSFFLDIVVSRILYIVFLFFESERWRYLGNIYIFDSVDLVLGVAAK